MKNLYLVTTEGLGDYHVLANDPGEAENALKRILDEQDYGFSHARRITNIKWLSEAFGESLSDKAKPFLSDKSKRLLIVKHWAYAISVKMENEIPRRNMLDLNTPAEKAIYNAMQEVEKLPADVRLTEAITLLAKAKDLVSDLVDSN